MAVEEKKGKTATTDTEKLELWQVMELLEVGRVMELFEERGTVQTCR